MIATKTVARIMQREYRRRLKDHEHINWLALASVVRTALVKSMKPRKPRNGVKLREVA